MVDSHLVMNVLNLMAALEFKEHGTENPLLFALSDYLQQAFLQTERSAPLISEELQLLQTQLTLLALASSSVLNLKIESNLPSKHKISAGHLCSVASHLFNSPDKKWGRKTRMTIALQGTPMQLTSRVLMSIEESSDAEPLDIFTAQCRLEKSLLATDQKELAHLPPQWSQQHPQHLQVIYFLALND